MTSRPKPLAEQMAVLNNNFDETNDSASFAENSLLNATCPARIQNNTSVSDRVNTSMNDGEGSRRAPLSRRLKREPLRITPLAQIDEVPSHRRSHGKHSESYKTKLCDAFRRQGHCAYNNDCPYAHGTDELRMPPRRKPFLRNMETTRYRRDSGDESDRIPRHRETNRGSYYSTSRQICKNFERGNCRYGPRCKYIHREQMPVFDHNASHFMPPEHPMPFYQNGQCYVPAQPYFMPQQYGRVDLNQTMPVFSGPPMGMNSTFYYQPMAPTPVMDQAPTPQPLLMMPELAPPESLYGPAPPELMADFPDGFFQQPPPLLLPTH